VNYEDPNFNISLPVFAIHGNHDDPTGENGLSAMDLLSISNLVNYFGKSPSIDDIHVKPILITKGVTKLALYGLGHIRDERLYQTFKQKKVKFYRPANDNADANASDWFNLFVIHQNRSQHHSKKSNISESFLRGFFDLVVWGHEHEQKIAPTHSTEGNFEVIQPGSSIVTGLVPEEAKPKKICMLEIHKDQYRFEELDLRTVRPFVMDQIALKDYEELDEEKNNVEEIAEFLSAKVDEMLATAEKKWKEQTKDVDEETGSGKLLKEHGKALKLPLVRLKVDYSGGYASVNPQRFGQRFADRVANPADILLMTRSKQKSAKPSKSNAAEDEEMEPTSKDSILKTLLASRNDDDDNQEFLEAASNALTSGITIEDLVGQYLKKNGLTLFNEFNLQDAVESFVKKEETHSIDDFVSKELKKRQERLWKDTKKVPLDQPNKKTTEEIEELLQKYIDEEQADIEVDQNQRRAGQATSRLQHGGSDDEEEEEVKPKKRVTKGKKKEESDDDEMPRSPTRAKVDDSDDEAPKKATRGRGRGKGVSTSTRGKTSTRGRGRGRGKKKEESEEEEEEPSQASEEDEEEVKPKRKTRAAATKKAPAKATGKRKKADSDEEDEKLDFLDQESDEEPAKKKRKTTAAPKKSKFVSIDSD
jgi:double-strand break repair protein MRE11